MTMNTTLAIALETLEIASPCSEDWAKMNGDERVRACGACDQKVYNVAGMTRAEAEALIQNAEGRLCLRLLRRHDGTVLTRDCPAPLRRQRQRTRWQRAALALGLGSFFGAPLQGCSDGSGGIELPPVFKPETYQVMGKVCPPAPTPAEMAARSLQQQQYAEEQRLAEEEQREEDARLADEQARQLEKARQAEEARRAEKSRLCAEARLQVEAQRAEKERRYEEEQGAAKERRLEAEGRAEEVKR